MNVAGLGNSKSGNPKRTYFVHPKTYFLSTLSYFDSVFAGFMWRRFGDNSSGGTPTLSKFPRSLRTQYSKYFCFAYFPGSSGFISLPIWIIPACKFEVLGIIIQCSFFHQLRPVYCPCKVKYLAFGAGSEWK